MTTSSDLRLIEMKTTRKPIVGAELRNFFFGATEREYAMAKALGDRYLFAFIVLNDANQYGRPFAALLSLEEVGASNTSTQDSVSGQLPKRYRAQRRWPGARRSSATESTFHTQT